jgi:GntR family transcriptional regulator
MTILDSVRYLSEPLLTPPGQPLRVAVYSRISQGIRSGSFVAGSLLPRETQLALALGVSRTVVREALMLLEEDGLISTKRGVGRFVADSASHAMLDELQSIERLLQSPTKALAVAPVEFTFQTVTDIVVELLALEPQADFWFRESIATRDGQPIALVQEYLPDEIYLAKLDSEVSKNLRDAAEENATLLHALTNRLGPIFTSGECRIAASVAGPTRAGQLGIKASDPLLVLTQTALLGGVPAYISKCAFPPAFGYLAVTRWSPSPTL